MSECVHALALKSKRFVGHNWILGQEKVTEFPQFFLGGFITNSGHIHIIKAGQTLFHI